MATKKLALSALALTCLAFAASPVLAEITLKFHHDLPKDSAQHVAAVKFKEAVESRTRGESLRRHVRGRRR